MAGYVQDPLDVEEVGREDSGGRGGRELPFADASGWSEVIQRLSALGYTAYAPANPLRGVISDGDYVRTLLSTIQGPVVLVGHSHGGRPGHPRST
jgi:hypothetical protein